MKLFNIVVLGALTLSMSAFSEELKPIRYAKMSYSVSEGGVVICSGSVESVPVFETRKSPENFYFTPYLSTCNGSKKKQSEGLRFWVGGAIANERASGLAKTDQKTSNLNVALEEVKSGREIAFSSNWAGVEELQNVAVNFELYLTYQENKGDETSVNRRFRVQTRFEDFYLK